MPEEGVEPSRPEGHGILSAWELRLVEQIDGFAEPFHAAPVTEYHSDALSFTLSVRVQ